MMSKVVYNITLGYIIFLGYIIVGVTILGEHYYIFDIFSHFYIQYFFLGIIVFIFSVVLKSKKHIYTCAFLLIFLFFQIFTIFQVHTHSSSQVDIYYVNANYYKNNYDDLLLDIQRYKAKYIMIVELNDDLVKRIQNTLNTQNNYIHNAGVSSYGLFTDEEIIGYKNLDLEYPVGEFILKEGKVLLIHPFPPVNSYLAAKQKEHFSTLQKYYDTLPEENSYMLGDFNSSHYSRVFQRYFGELDYRVIYSWNRGKIYSIPIDYILGKHSSFDVFTNSSNHSDHSPLLIDLK